MVVAGPFGEISQQAFVAKIDAASKANTGRRRLIIEDVGRELV
jgi:hypothetical protein